MSSCKSSNGDQPPNSAQDSPSGRQDDFWERFGQNFQKGAKLFRGVALGLAGLMASCTLIFVKLDLLDLYGSRKLNRGEFRGEVLGRLAENMRLALKAECCKYCGYLTGSMEKWMWVLQPLPDDDFYLSRNQDMALGELNRILYGNMQGSLDSCEFEIMGYNRENFLAVVQFNGTRNDVSDDKIIQLRVAFEGTFAVWIDGGSTWGTSKAEDALPGQGAPRIYPVWKTSDEFPFGVISKKKAGNIDHKLRGQSTQFLKGVRKRRNSIPRRMPQGRRVQHRM